MSWPPERARHGGVDEVPLPAERGRLSLCGKHAIAPDPEALLARLAGSSVICLNETDELIGRYPDYVSWLRANRPERAVWFPIPDFHVPSVAELQALLDGLVDRLGRDEHLVVHCGAGIGRAGTVAAALLMELGLDVEAAVALVAASRPGAGPQNHTQRQLLDDLAAAQAGAGG